ncbi:MAG: GAF domain-containing protein [Deltaproteobacteria bacterium]|nr:GAF domain-containing protein [Deltaproteobacteria bacterium]
MKKNSTSIEDALEQIEELNIRFAALNAVSKIVSSGLNLDEILSNIIDKILDAPGPESVRIYLLNNGGKVLNLAAHKGLSADLTNNSLMRSRRPGDGLLGQTLLDGEPKVIDNTLESIGPDIDLLIEEGFQSTVYIPLTTQGASIGVMCVSSLNPNTFSSEVVEFLTVIGNHIGIAVDNATMHKNIKEAYQDLKEVQEQIVWTEKLASLGKLAATIAHEINNPLAGVLNYIRLIIKQLSRNRFSHEKLEDISRYLKIMESETARCSEIVKDLLAFSRRTKITMESNRIEDIIHKTLNLISHELEMKDLQLIKNIAPNLPKVKCDFKQIQQVLFNLMYNASEAMPNGGTLTITVHRTNGAKSFLEVAISDTGCGISEKDMENIFEPFFTTKEEEKGVGLGLSVVYGIIAKHNGTITVESELGKGSTFRVQLPCA